MAKACKTPCKGCPFSRRTEQGKLGGSPVEVYLGQVVMPFWLPCHNGANYEGNNTTLREGQLQCGGAARLRATLGLNDLMPEGIASLPRVEDDPDLFKGLADFYQHHTGCTDEEAEKATTPERLHAYAQAEIMRAREEGKL